MPQIKPEDVIETLLAVRDQSVCWCSRGHAFKSLRATDHAPQCEQAQALMVKALEAL